MTGMFHPEGPTLFELAKQAFSSTDEGYDLLAPKFDYTPFRTPDAVLDAAQAIIGSGRAGLDVCCGTGAGAFMLRRVCSERVVGIDRSPGMLAEAQRQLDASSSGTQIDFQQADALSMPFTDAFDLAVCFGAHGHILPKDERAFVRSIHRALEPGGRFVFATRELPPKMAFSYWAARGFNAAMHVRNWLFKPEFIMYYLTFLWPDVQKLLRMRASM